MNPRCPPTPITFEDKVAEVDLGEATKDPEGGCRCRGTGLTSFLILVLVILGDFYKG